MTNSVFMLPGGAPLPIPFEPPPVAVRGLERELWLTSIAASIEYASLLPEAIRDELLSGLKQHFLAGRGVVHLVPMLPGDVPESPPRVDHRALLVKVLTATVMEAIRISGGHGLTDAEWAELQRLASEARR